MQPCPKHSARQAALFYEGFDIGQQLYVEIAFRACWPDGTEARRCLFSQRHLLHEERRPDAPMQATATLHTLQQQRRTAYRRGEVAGFLTAWMEDILATAPSGQPAAV